MNAHDPLVPVQARVYRQIRHAGRPLDQLQRWVLAPELLAAAWQRVSRNAGADTPGVDRMTCRDIAPRVQPWLAQLAGQLTLGTYRPLVPRWIDVPKHNGSSATRRLGILCIRDRVVHTAVKAVLEPVLEPTFSASSFGFRPGRSVAAALHQATRRLRHRAGQPSPYSYAAHLDVARCFDSLDHRLLRETLACHVADPAFLGLVDRLIAAGGQTRRSWWFTRRRGIVQGSALSPLLCNLYLDGLDKQLEGLRTATGGAVCCLRYADDLLLLARDRSAARRALAVIRRTLARRRLALGERPALVPIQQGVRWLGVLIRPRNASFDGFVPFGYVVPDDKIRSLLTIVDEMTQPLSPRIAADSINPGRWLVSLNEQLRQWREAYVYADNAAEVFQAVDRHVRDRVGQWLRRVGTGRRGAAVAAQCVRLPRGFSTWEADGVRLVVLSALAPRCPQPKVRKPAWQQPGRSQPPSRK